MLDKIKDRFEEIDLDKLSIHLTIITGVLWLWTLLFNYLEILPSYLNIKLFFSLFIASGVFYFVQLIKKIPESARDKSSIIYYFSHCFLLSLVVIAVNQFLKRAWIIDNLFYISVVSIAFGFLTFYAHRNRVEKEIEDEKEEEEKAEKKREGEFDDKFPRLNKMWGLGGIVRWMYKEGWGFSVGLIVIIIVGLWLRLRLTGQLSLWVDEANSVLVAKRIAGGFGQTLMDGSLYDRAFIYHHYLGYIFKLFSNVNIYVLGRVANIPFFMGTIILLYIFVSKLLNKTIALLSSFFFSLSSVAIMLFREVRFYEMYLLFYFATAILIYYSIDILSKKNIFKKENLKKIILLIILTGVIGAIAIDTHLLSFFIIYCALLYSFLLGVFKKPKSLIISGGLFLLLISILYIKNYKFKFDIENLFIFNAGEWTSGINQSFNNFWNFLISNQYSLLMTLSFLFIILLLVFRKNKKLLFFFSFTFMSYSIIAMQGIGNRIIRYHYPFILFLCIIFAIYIYYFIKYFSKNKIQRIILILIFSIAIMLSIPSTWDESNSALEKNSIFLMKDIDSNRALKFLQDNYDLENYKTILHTQYAMPYYVYFDNPPDFIINPKWAENNGENYTYLNVPLIGAEEGYNKIKDNVIVIIYYDTSERSKQLFDFFEKNSERIYGSKKGRILIYN